MSDSFYDLIISRGDIVLADSIVKKGSIAIKDCRVAAVFNETQSASLNINSAKKVIDATNKLIFPGIVDAHVHCYSNPDEGFSTASAAAAAGGVTSIIEMPYDKPNAINNADLFKDKISRVNNLSKVDMALMATVNKSGDIAFLDEISRLGLCSIKLSLFETDPVRFPRIEDNILWEILPKLGRMGMPVGFHAENDVIIESLISKYIADGRTTPVDHCLTRPPITETMSVLKLLEFCYWAKFKLHLPHISHSRSIELAKWYKTLGADVTVETCPHYLVMDEGDMIKKGAFAKINPPLRQREVVEKLWKAIVDNDVDIIASDHAPWNINLKQNESIFKNASGAPGLETMLSITYNEGVVNRGLSPTFITRMMSQNPAKRYGIYPYKGSLDIDASADLVIFDPNKRWVIDANKSQSVAKWSPYQDMMIQGKIDKTILRGEVIYQDDQVLAKDGFGKYVAANFN